MRPFRSAFLFACLLTAVSCNRYITDYIPSAEFRGIKVSAEDIQPHVSLQSVDKVWLTGKMILDFKYLFRNPYSKPLRIPAHTVTFYLRGSVTPSCSIPKDTFSIPAKGQAIQHYVVTLKLDDSKMRECLGKDNQYEFRCVIAIDLKDYIGGNAALFSFLSDFGGTKFNLKFSFIDTLRVPKPPLVLPCASQTARIEFTGRMDTVDLKALDNIKGSMTDFIDKIIKGHASVPDPDQPYNTKEITVGNVTQSVPNPWKPWETVDVQVPGITVTVIDPDRPIRYKDYKMTDLLAKFLSSSSTYFTSFDSAWATFKAFHPVITFPGQKIEGIRATLPVRIHNPNEFAIDCPALSSEAHLGNYSPFAVHFFPSDGAKTIPGGGDLDINLVGDLNWNNDFLTFFQHPMTSFGPKITGYVRFDLGYGSVEIPFPEN